MTLKHTQACRISREADVYHARSLVRRVALAAGASAQEAAELEIVASELAWNVLRHVGIGTLEVSIQEDSPPVRQLSITVTDPGAPVDLVSVVQDGWTGSGPLTPDDRVGRKGIGCGLGAVVRLTDRLEQRVLSEGKSFIATRTLEHRSGCQWPQHRGKPTRQG